MESLELGRRFKRSCDVYSSRRLTIVIILFLLFLFYILPDFVRWLGFGSSSIAVKDDMEKCIQDRLTSFYSESDEFNANIRHEPPRSTDNPYVAYVGNGYFGIDLTGDKSIYIQKGRGLMLQAFFNPIFTVKSDFMSSYKEVFVTNYLTGIVHVFQCFDGGLYTSFQYYVHRTYQSILVQDIKISNPTDINIDVSLDSVRVENWLSTGSRTIGTSNDGSNVQFSAVTGLLNVSDDESIAISVIHQKLPIRIHVEARSSKNLNYLTALQYTNPIKKTIAGVKKNEVEKNATDALKKVLVLNKSNIKKRHAEAWQELWSTGLTVGTSKAAGALNGDKINATMYYVLSQVILKPIKGSTKESAELANRLAYAEGCYGSHHTLDASNLWGTLDSVENVNKIVSYWLLTLEKVGCHNLVKAGALGVVEAMVLSFGGLGFRNQHLEFNIHPKYLHREYLFRRISYGNMTHLNISVVLREDNRAVLYVALDRSDKNYYACDGGCLDEPALLSKEKREFPVKLTEPLTPILYVTYDKQHMEDLKHTIHVKEIADAPAHDHHVIALHKHGHKLGGLPTFFWVAVSTLIVIFHLFLFKLIYNEYCSGNTFDKHRFRYGKL